MSWLNFHIPADVNIDPSIVVTTTADFRTGSDDGMIDYSTANQIKRNAVTLGTVGATSQQTSAFTNARYKHTSVAYNGYLYVIGGQDGTNLYNDVIRLPINSDGSVGSETRQTSAFTTARHSHSSVAYNGYLYVIGGCSAGACTAYENDIIRLPINGDGSVGSETRQTNAFTTARENHTSVAYNGYLYVIGGTDGTARNDIIHCPINADGSVGTCVQQTSAFTTARYHHTSVAYNGYLYVIGGFGGTYQNDIQHIPINADGSVGTTVSQAAAFTTARGAHTSVAYNGYLYVIGGTDGTARDDIQNIPIRGDGSVGTTVSEAAAFTTARHRHTSVAYNGYLYIIGGNTGSPQNDVQHLLIDTGTPTGGAVGTTTQQTNAFTTARTTHTSVVYNGYLYIIGGCTVSSSCTYENDVIRLPINADGSVGTETRQTNAFTTARVGHGSVAYNGYLYVIGGTDGTYQNDIIRLPINADGSVGSETRQTNAFTTARSLYSPVAYNGYLYIIGGFDGTNQNDIQYCPINADGSIGTCTQQTNAFSNARRGQTSVAYNGYLYVIGGYDGTNSYDDVIRLPINSDGSVGAETRQTAAFPTARQLHSSVAYNGYMYVIGGVASGAFRNDIVRMPINSDGSVGAYTQQTAAFTTARQDHTSVVYNGYLYIAGGCSAGSPCGTFHNDVQRLLISSSAQIAHYERIIDTTGAYKINSVSFNGTMPCGAHLSYATAGSDGIFGSVTKLPFVLPATTYTINAASKRYLWIQLVLNDSECGSFSNITDITVSYNAPPDAPTLSTPASGAVSVSLTPQFQMRTTDDGNDYLRYEIVLYDSSCTGTPIRTIDQNGSQTGWSGQDADSGNAYVGNAVITSSTMGVHIYQTPALSYNTTYCWKARAKDPGGSNAWGNYSATQLFTTNQSPAAPTLTLPASGATGVSTLPQFRMYANDVDSDYLKYKILVYQSDCSTLVRTIDQTSSQTGWVGQSQQSATAYSSGQEAIHNYQTAALTANTTYCWKAQAKDPGATDTFGSFSATQSFTTAPATQTNVNIGGGTTIYGGTTIGQ